MFQLESICHNRLQYDSGLLAVSQDSFYDTDWQSWILIVRQQIGIVDIADLIFLRSWHCVNIQNRRSRQPIAPDQAILFGEKEGQIALANSRKDPLFLFAALQRHLGYPKVPRPMPVDESENRLAVVQQKLAQLTQRMKLLEAENRGGIDLSKHYEAPP